jgi:hypothetical protein
LHEMILPTAFSLRRGIEVREIRLKST